MDAKVAYLVPVETAWQVSVSKVGGKSRNISTCNKEGFRVPDGFAVTTDSYFEFIENNNLAHNIDQELMKKNAEDMRWEEVWDSALRIRLAFTKGKMPKQMEIEIMEAVAKWPAGTKFAVRSSSPDEDSKEFSFAGVHESYINVSGGQQIIEKVKLVWASLWSDRALLYKKESGLDPAKSAMAVLVQKMEYRDISGLAFTMDPSSGDREHIIVEAIRGTLNLLVDNKKAPERFRISKMTGEAVGNGEALGNGEVLGTGKATKIFSGKTLDQASLKVLYNKIIKLEQVFGVPIDIEWTGVEDEFTVLQVRPITVFKKDENKEREWYLTLTPSGEKLIELAEKVENELIPALKMEGNQLSQKSPEGLQEAELLEELKKRGESYSKWEKVYRDDFIPFANGIRNFGSYYNDMMKPEDPYEFVLLLKTKDMLAQKRNARIKDLADKLRNEPKVKTRIVEMIETRILGEQLVQELETSGGEFASLFLEFLNNEMDVSYNNTSLKSAPEAILRVITSLADAPEENIPGEDAPGTGNDTANANATRINVPQTNAEETALASRYYEKILEQGNTDVGEQWLKIGRVSWKLRDDDNILLGKIENQLLVFIQECLKRLYKANRIGAMPKKYEISQWKTLYDGFFGKDPIELPEEKIDETKEEKNQGKARQIVGQPSSPGVITGLARVIRTIDDFKNVSKGEVLVFDAVEPQMTFIISLAGAIVERRGGMLVHSSIIAREMRIPAVNGVPKATELIKTGDLVTVNGDIGIVVIGKPEFEVEFGATTP